MALDRKKYMKDVEMKEIFPTLNHAQQVYVKRIERENYDRALAVKKLRRRNFRTGIGLGLFVISSCILLQLHNFGHV